MELAMPLMVRFVIAPGFADIRTNSRSRSAGDVMFPYLMCMSLTAMMSGMLNSLHHYFAAAIAPVFLNVILIGVLFYAWYTGADALRRPGISPGACWPPASCSSPSSMSACAMPA
jgi:putative peptidoglycan lipid II flippase